MADRPTHGGRVLLELDGQDDRCVGYRVTLATPQGSWQGRAEVIVADGAVTLQGLDEGVPGWLADATRAFVRSLWTARRGAAPAPWPRRVLRWRAAPG